MKETKEIYDWTIMIYFGGDNNLSEEMIWAIKDIQSWRRSQTEPRKVKVCILFDAGGPPVPIDDDELLVRDARALTSEKLRSRAAVERLAPVDGGNGGAAILDQTIAAREKADKEKAEKETVTVPSVQTTLQEFILDIFRKHPAKHHMIVLSGHGSGAIGDFLTGDKRISGLTIPGLGDALSAVGSKYATKKKPKPIDILGMDACQMSMAEVACQVQESVQFMIGAEGFQPNTGWPYEDVLNLLGKAKIAGDAGEFAEAIVRTHAGYYLDYASADLSTDISVLNLDALDELQTALKEFTGALDIKRQSQEEWESDGKLSAEELSKKLDVAKGAKQLRDPRLFAAIVLSHWQAQGYKREQYTDLWDFCNLLSDRLEPWKDSEYKELYAACEHIKKVIDPGQLVDQTKRFVRISGYSGPQFQHSHGVSVFFPWASLMDAAGITDIRYYQTLKFARATAWDEFIRLYLYVTQREVRTVDTAPGKNFPSLLNRRTGLFIPALGRDPEYNSLDKTKLGTAKIESMKNPAIEWRKWFEQPSVAKAVKSTPL